MIETCGYTMDHYHTGYDWLPSWTSLDPVVHAGCHLSQLHCQSVIDWTRLTQKDNVCTPSYVGFCCIVPSCSYSEMIFYSTIVNCCYFPSVLWHFWLGDWKGIRADDIDLTGVLQTYSSSCHYHLHHRVPIWSSGTVCWLSMPNQLYRSGYESGTGSKN